MACSHNVVFLLDTAGSVQKRQLHLGTLRILNYLGCRFGLAKVRWGFKFFDSLGNQGRTSRVGSFRELGSRSWEEFEDELEARFGNQACSLRLSGPAPRAVLTQNILKETLLDYQWDRPEIASPAKPVLRSQKNKSSVSLDKPPLISSPSEGFVNAVFLFSPCPHSQRELLQFISGSHAHLSDDLLTLHDVAEKFIPKGIQEMMAGQKITLYWVDTAEWSKLLESPDHVGYWMLDELMCLLGGTILPSEILIQSLSHRGLPCRKGVFPAEFKTSELPFIPWTTILPFDSSLNYLFSLPSALQAFPQLEGVLLFMTDEVKRPQSCAVTLEPLTVSQSLLESPVNISLKCAMTRWNIAYAGSFCTESWVLRSSSAGQSAQETSLFQQLVKYVLGQGLHVVAEVSPSGTCLPCTGIFSPISDTAAVLSLLCGERAADAEGCIPRTSVKESLPQDQELSLPEIVRSVLNHVEDLKEDYLAIPAETPVPDWAQQELNRTRRWSPSVIEGWYPFSNLCGASSHLMESFRLLQAPSAPAEGAPVPEVDVTHCLSELYQRKASEVSATSHQRDHRKRRGVPRTPVRQKMKTMPRSLQMLNVARLNVKAQKCQPDEEPSASEKVSQRLSSRRSDDKLEERGRTAKAKIGFKTEEEMLSYLTANYQKAVLDGKNLSACARDMVTAASAFQKSNVINQREAACMETIQKCVLKNSTAVRQQLGSNPDKEVKIKECQLQVYLRLEMALQCPSLQSNTAELETLVEEMTEMLRILCLTEDPAYLTKFLEEVVEIYMESIPKTLGDLYYSLGTQIPPKLASVLPADFFSDDSLSQESQTPSLAASTASITASRTHSLSTEADQLEELRTRSAKKRKGALASHRSMTEASQNLRQIEIPQVPKNRSRKDSSHACPDVKLPPAVQKMAVQEVTKVRRNLFNKGMLSPGKRIPRSQSVSALEGLKHKRHQSTESPRDNHKLLTKRVAETPAHKQISRRLLHKQIKGRSSDPGTGVGIVEESPEKDIACGLRRSPRIKQLLLDRTFSGSFYSSQLSMRRIHQVPPACQEGPGAQDDSTEVALPAVKRAMSSPKSLLFGAVLEASSSRGMDSPRARRKSLASDEPAAYQTPRKAPPRLLQRLMSHPNNTPRRSPRIQEKLQQTPQKILAPKQAAAKNLRHLFSPCRRKSGFLSESSKKEGDYLAQPILTKKMFSSPCKAESPGKQGVLGDVFASPASSSNSAGALSVTTPLLLNSWGKPASELQSPRRSLRVAQKTASPVSARRLTHERERLADPELCLPFKLDWVPPARAPTESRNASSELTSHPESARLIEALKDEPVELLLDNSPPCTLPLNAVGMCTLSPVRICELGRKTRTPQKSPKPLNFANVSPAKSPSCIFEEHSNTAHGGKEEYQRDGGTNFPAKVNLFCKPGSPASKTLVPRHEQTTGATAPNKKSNLSPPLSSKGSLCFPDAIVMCERLESSSPANTGGCVSLAVCSQVKQGLDTSPSRELPVEKSIGLQQLLFQSSPRLGRPALPATLKAVSRAYALRCTPDRRQREAAARLGNPEKAATPSRICTLPSAPSPPTYKVELEMQASGLPKLRIKRVASESPLEPQPCGEAGEEGDLAPGDLSVAWCRRHPGKIEPVSVSPSCFRSAHSTPGKFGGGQTYICQSYTPTHCPSSAASPARSSVGVPWTPSPKQKGKVTPEAIKDWPRRKRATVGCSRSDRHTGAAGEMPACDEQGLRTSAFFSGDKALLLGEFELEGVCRLQDQSPCSDMEPSGEESVCRAMAGLKSKKRAFERLSPEKGARHDVKKSCLKRADPDVDVSSMEQLSSGEGEVSSSRTNLEEDEVFSFSGLTPPTSSKNSISTSGLWALTQSPLLYQGYATSLRKCPTDDDSSVFGPANEDFSPFRSLASRQRPIKRTYSRKRLLS